MVARAGARSSTSELTADPPAAPEQSVSPLKQDKTTGRPCGHVKVGRSSDPDPHSGTSHQERKAAGWEGPESSSTKTQTITASDGKLDTGKKTEGADTRPIPGLNWYQLPITCELD